MNLTDEQVLQAKQSHGTHKAAAAALGVPPSTYGDALKRAQQRAGVPGNVSAPQGRTLSEWRLTHDLSVHIPNKIRAALESLQQKHGKEHWEYETDFVTISGVSQAHLSKFREQFTAHVVVAPSLGKRAPRTVWFVSPKVAALARGDAQ